MSRLIVPSRQLLAVVDQDRAELEAAVERLGRARFVQWFISELKAIDERLELHRAKPSLPPGSPLKAGYWYAMRRVDGAPDQYIPWESPDGSFRDLTADFLDFLRARDLWNRDVYEHATKRHQREEDARQRQLADGRDERADEMATMIKAIDSPGVLFSDAKWSSRSRGRRGRRAG